MWKTLRIGELDINGNSHDAMMMTVQLERLHNIAVASWASKKIFRNLFHSISYVYCVLCYKVYLLVSGYVCKVFTTLRII